MVDSSNETEFNNNYDQNDAEVEVNEKTATKWKKRKNPSFTNEYFEKIIDPKTGDELRICKILDDDGNQCKKTYRNTGSSTGNLIQHLDLVHKIVSQENEKKKPRTTKITDYVKSTQPHLPHIQRQQKEARNISLTTDFWSSRAKYGYLGVTATWITPDLKIKDVMLEINYISSPHMYTAVVIADSLHKIISN
ncbi:hypothetical protein RhiirA1_476483 [Rhizophagus irregularis]|uniref:BED-type domain-containing protein n=1 Tax=Rhizophagus irregularis TaxID=588596 RepID=A0A2N0QV06_9GLOM|nr:hypothetical protein RhiirA1_476483 [Rhizophagus irregularis]